MSAAAAIPPMTQPQRDRHTTSVPCPNGNVFRASCKKRTCPVCGLRWARDWTKVMFVNLGAYDGPVILVTITAPGADLLPWDEAHCAGKHSRGGEHGGKRGCRVEPRAAAEWTASATTRWGMLRQAAARVARTKAPVPVTLLERVWEPQKRGVAHLHLVLGAATAGEIEAAAIFIAKLKELAPSYSFGFVDARGKKGHRNERVVARGQILQLVAAETAARYLSAYLTGRSKKKPSIRETVVDPAMTYLTGTEKRHALPIVWLTPKLTRITLTTMRSLRRARHVWAYAERKICEEPPKWAIVERDGRLTLDEPIAAGAAYRRAYRRHGEATDEAALRRVIEQAQSLADRTLAQIDMLPKSGPNWHERVRAEASLQDFGTQIAIGIAGIRRTENTDALAVAA